jgi:hypothetical protein
MIEPKALALLIAIRLTNPHLMRRESRLVHSVVQEVVWLTGLGEVRPDIGYDPIINGIDIAYVLALLGSPALAV